MELEKFAVKVATVREQFTLEANPNDIIFS